MLIFNGCRAPIENTEHYIDMTTTVTERFILAKISTT